jgi:hypothetical protein
MASRIQVLAPQAVSALSKTDRIGRYPKHTFSVISKPFSVTPFGIAPVLPGETIQSIFMESRVITDPIKNAITGWKKDYFFFYVKATTLSGDGSAIRNMFVDLDDNTLLAGALIADDQKYYTAKGGQPFLKQAIDQIILNYFRDEGEAVTVKPDIYGYPVAQIRETSWLESLIDKDLVPDQLALDAAADTGDIERLLTAFETLRSMGLANISWEEYLASFGIAATPLEDTVKPQLLFHTNDFQYPSNTINPADGTPSSAVSWVFRQGENKKRTFFKEPGFIVGVTVTRPKVFFSGLAGSMSAHLDRAWDWMPELLINLPASSLKKFEPGTGPLGDRTTDTDAYFADMRDLFTSGDQFQNRTIFDPNMAADNSAINSLQLPAVDLNWKYPTEAMVNALFKTTTAVTIREDGYFSLSIKGKQRDHTPNSNLLVV